MALDKKGNVVMSVVPFALHVSLDFDLVLLHLVDVAEVGNGAGEYAREGGGEDESGPCCVRHEGYAVVESTVRRHCCALSHVTGRYIEMYIESLNKAPLYTLRTCLIAGT